MTAQSKQEKWGVGSNMDTEFLLLSRVTRRLGSGKTDCNMAKASWSREMERIKKVCLGTAWNMAKVCQNGWTRIMGLGMIGRNTSRKGFKSEIRNMDMALRSSAMATCTRVIKTWAKDMERVSWHGSPVHITSETGCSTRWRAMGCYAGLCLGGSKKGKWKTACAMESAHSHGEMATVNRAVSS